MKRLLTVSLAAFAVFALSCTKISSMKEELEYLNSRTEAIESWVSEMQNETEELKSVIQALATNDRIVDMQFIYDEQTLEPISCTIYFDKSEPVLILLKGRSGDKGATGTDGKDGADGKDGQDGADGPPGADGKKPLISAGEYEGSYYWMSDGKWIYDDNGERIPFSAGSDFRMKSEDGRWYASFDSGKSWIEMDPFEYDFSGIADVIPSEDKVNFILDDGTVICLPLKTVVSFSLSREGCLDAVAGATYNLSYNISGVEDAVVSVMANSKMGHAYVTPASAVKGTVTYTLSEQHEVAEQKLMLVLTHAGGTLTKMLTFNEKGQLTVGPVEPVSAEGGECIVATALSGYSSMNAEVVSGGSWFRFSSTSSAGYIYQVDPNDSEDSRIAEIRYTVRNQYFSILFTKTVQIVQFGTGEKAGYYDYLGSWTMSGTDALTGQEVSGSVRIMKNDGLADSYVIYGLSPYSGEKYPVYASYERQTGKMILKLPQEGLDGTDTGLYAVSLSGDSPVLDQEGRTFSFTAKGNGMTADMDLQSSFMYMDENGSVMLDDKVFYSAVSLTRDGISATYEDGQVVMLNEASPAFTPLNLVILGDGYQLKDLRQGGKFERSARGAVSSFFAVEPFASFKDRFNIYMIPFASADDGPDVTASGIVHDTYFSSVCAGGGNTLVTCDYDTVLDVVSDLGLTAENHDLYRTVVILLVNTTEQSGSCWYIKAGKTDEANVGDGIMSMAIAMLAADTMGSNGLIRHEAGGHAFGRLADEYNWGGTADDAKKASLLDQQNNYGFYLNVTADTDESSSWAKFIGLEGYDNVGYYEGAWGCSSGLYRPTESSIMLNNQGEFNAPSREIIYKRIILQTEGPGAYTFEKFLEYDKRNL